MKNMDLDKANKVIDFISVLALIAFLAALIDFVVKALEKV